MTVYALIANFLEDQGSMAVLAGCLFVAAFQVKTDRIVRKGNILQIH
jgi:hypothetical protein